MYQLIIADDEEIIRTGLRDANDWRSCGVEVAEYMQMNPAYLSRYFKENTGMNFVDYCRRIRMKRARELLQNTSLKVYEIASRLGYQNAQAFGTAFKECEGVSPFAYRSGRSDAPREDGDKA